jgi:hypothetical protein
MDEWKHLFQCTASTKQHIKKLKAPFNRIYIITVIILPYRARNSLTAYDYHTVEAVIATYIHKYYITQGNFLQHKIA